MHIHSNIKPKVRKSCSKLCGVRPKEATAMDGSTNPLFSPFLIAEAERIAGLQASISSMTYSLVSAVTYSSKVLSEHSIFAFTSLYNSFFFARVDIFREYARRISLANAASRLTLSTVEISTLQTEFT